MGKSDCFQECYTNLINPTAFGHGHHSCPGRFFVANEIKILIAHILLCYDIKLREGESRPANMYNNIMILPHMTAEVLFRRRHDIEKA